MSRPGWDAGGLGTTATTRAMSFAVISDIHSNLEALTTVLADIDRRGLEQILCLGDVIGYGASPRQCLDLVIERCELTLCGNHDQAVFFEPFNFNPPAERACYWTRRLFETEEDKDKRDRRWDYLGQLPVKFEANGLLFVHGSPRRPVNEYLFSDDVYTNPQKLVANFERLDGKQACFVGHTHVPGVFFEDPYFDPPSELTPPKLYLIGEDERVIINVGSVGQPRDRDIRASYVVVHDAPPDDLDGATVAQLDGEGPVVEFIRLDYDVETAVNKIHEQAELDDFLGDRLREGR